MKSYQIMLELQEPTTVGAQRMIGNQAPSLDHIPATALRGSLAAALARKGRTSRLATLFGGASPRWCPAWPCSTDNNEVVVPMPLSYKRAKGDDGFEGALGVINTLKAQRPTNAAAYKSLFGADLPSDTDRIQWVGMAPGWLKFTFTDDKKGAVSLGKITPKVENAMFHGADYMTGAARDGWLFSREAVTEFQTFTAYVVDEQEVIQEDDKLQLREIFLGKRITAGNGRAILEWHPAPDLPPWATCAPTDAEDVIIQIMSPAVIPAQNGGFLTGLDETVWNTILGVTIELKSAQSDAAAVHGWITAWDLPRERYTAIAAGSCYHLHLQNTQDKAQFHTALKSLVEKGLGIRTGEGFGWVAVSPPWLDKSFHPGLNTNAGPFNPEKLVDAGLLLHGSKRDLIKHAYAFANAPGVENKVAELAAIADRVDTVTELQNYLKGLAERTNARKWDKVQEAWHTHGRPHVNTTDTEAMRYFLSWAKTFAVKNID